jgi:hypothetical protein
MKIEVKQSTFVNNLLNPVSKLADNLALDVSNTEVRAFVSTPDNSLILSVCIPCKAEKAFKCVIPECKTFLRLLSGITKDVLSINIEPNHIAYKDDLITFKYHLLDESYIVGKKTISEQKLNTIEFDTKIVVTRSKLSEIIKYNSIVPDAEKLYFFTEGDRVYAKLGDEQKSNVNEITTEVSSSFQGMPLIEKFPINIQSILLFAFSDEEITIHVNHKLKVFKFSGTLLNYFVMGLIK